jgi:hypothetical protein
VDRKPSGTYCYRVATKFLVGQTPLASAFSNIVNVTVAPGIPRIVSRKVHGSQLKPPVFDIDLPLTGPAGIECRLGGGANSDTHEVVFQFGQPVTFTGASTSPGPDYVTGTSGNGTKEVTVFLGGVPKAQTITINLTGVSGAGTSPNISVPMGVLAGDTTADRRVNIEDTIQTKGRSGEDLSGANFRSDANIDGRINVGDTNFVKNNSGASLQP